MGSTVSGRKRAAPLISGDDLDRLIKRVKSGDVEAFEEVYSLYGKRILSYLYRMTGSRADAEDLTQDTFVLAFRKIESLQDNRKFQSWLYKIAQNNVYQKHRTRLPQMDSIDEDGSGELSDVQKLATPFKSPEKDLLSGELGKVVQKVIRSLPVKYREVFVMSAIQRMSYQEISETVGRSLASVKSDIHRARVNVRDQVKSYLGDNYGRSSLL